MTSLYYVCLDTPIAFRVPHILSVAVATIFLFLFLILFVPSFRKRLPT